MQNFKVKKVLLILGFLAGIIFSMFRITSSEEAVLEGKVTVVDEEVEIIYANSEGDAHE